MVVKVGPNQVLYDKPYVRNYHLTGEKKDSVLQLVRNIHSFRQLNYCARLRFIRYLPVRDLHSPKLTSMSKYKGFVNVKALLSGLCKPCVRWVMFILSYPKVFF